MTALSDALAAAQSRAVAALGNGPLTKAQASEVIEQLKAGNYDAGRWVRAVLMAGEPFPKSSQLARYAVGKLGEDGPRRLFGVTR